MRRSDALRNNGAAGDARSKASTHTPLKVVSSPAHDGSAARRNLIPVGVWKHWGGKGEGRGGGRDATSTAHLQLESVGFNGLDSRILAIYGAQPPGDGVHAVECGYEAQSIVDRNLCRVFREALHVNQAPRLVDDVPANRWAPSIEKF